MTTVLDIILYKYIWDETIDLDRKHILGIDWLLQRQ